MPLPRLILLTTLAMLAFASNSLLCRVALSMTQIDAASFTSLRLVSGAVMLALLFFGQRGGQGLAGSWRSALALFAYAAGFSFAYVELATGIGALLLFGAVQVSMIGFGLFKGERMSAVQVIGLMVAVIGLVGLLSPGVSAPPVLPAGLMVLAGVAWAVYSLRGRSAGDPVANTAGNFIRSLVFAVPLSLVCISHFQIDLYGALLAIASGAIASALGYILWYAVLPMFSATRAAILQFSAPALAAMGGVLLLDEALSLRLVLGFVAIMGGVAAYILSKDART